MTANKKKTLIVAFFVQTEFGSIYHAWPLILSKNNPG